MLDFLNEMVTEGDASDPHDFKIHTYNSVGRHKSTKGEPSQPSLSLLRGYVATNSRGRTQSEHDHDH